MTSTSMAVIRPELPVWEFNMLTRDTDLDTFEQDGVVKISFIKHEGEYTFIAEMLPELAEGRSVTLEILDNGVYGWENHRIGGYAEFNAKGRAIMPFVDLESVRDFRFTVS